MYICIYNYSLKLNIMSNSKLLVGSICFTDILELAKAGNKAFSRSKKNNKIYCSVNVWLNDEADQFGHNASIQTQFKDATKEEKKYVGNLKFLEFQKEEPAALTQNDTSFLPVEDDLPF